MTLNVRPGIASYNRCTIVDVSNVTADLSTTTRLLVLANLSPSYLQCWDMRGIYFHAYSTIIDYGSNICSQYHVAHVWRTNLSHQLTCIYCDKHGHHDAVFW